MYDTSLDSTTTYALDKYICIRGGYFAHIVFCYLTFLSGIGCFLSRPWPRARPWHPWLGRCYINAMLWATGTSILIHNTGLPTATLVSFIWVLGGLTIAWALINIHQIIMQRRATEAAAARIKEAGGAIPGGNLEALIAQEKGRIAASKGFVERMVSLKAAHGAIMFVSWLNIAGRIFASNQSGDFTCHTYPYYKQINTTHFDGAEQPLTPVPVHDPDYARLPWAKLGPAGWGAALSLGPLAGALLVGAIWAYFEAARARRAAAVAQSDGGAPTGQAA